MKTALPSLLVSGLLSLISLDLGSSSLQGSEQKETPSVFRQFEEIAAAFRTGDVSLARSLSQETHRPNRARQSAALQKMNAWRMAAAILYQEPSVEGIQRLAAEMHRLAEEGGAGAKETALMWVRVGQVDERIVSNYASAKTAYTKALAFDAECQPASEGLARLEQRERRVETLTQENEELRRFLSAQANR